MTGVATLRSEATAKFEAPTMQHERVGGLRARLLVRHLLDLTISLHAF